MPFTDLCSTNLIVARRNRTCIQRIRIVVERQRGKPFSHFARVSVGYMSLDAFLSFAWTKGLAAAICENLWPRILTLRFYAFSLFA
jgi:hypothetical protein